MSNSKSTICLNELDNDNVKDYIEFVNEVREDQTNTQIRCGLFHRPCGDDYHVMPVRVTTSKTIYEFDVPLEMDPLEETDEELLEGLLDYLDRAIKDYSDD